MTLPPTYDEAHWRPTDERRVVPLEGFEIDMTVPVGGLIPHMGRATGLILPRYRTERMWIRVWAEREWRIES